MAPLLVGWEGGGEREDRQFWGRINREMGQEIEPWRVEDLDRSAELGIKLPWEEQVPEWDREWETFESDREVKSQEERQNRDDREEKERDRGNNMFWR